MADHTGDGGAAGFGERWELPLSAQGAARRDAMLEGLLAEVPRAAASRRRRRGVALSAGAMLAAAVVIWAWAPGAPPSTRRPAASPASSVVRVTTDPGVVKRLAASGAGVTTELVSDDDLLRTLSAIGRPAGLVRDGDRVALTAEVADPIAPAPPAL